MGSGVGLGSGCFSSASFFSFRSSYAWSISSWPAFILLYALSAFASSSANGNQEASVNSVCFNSDASCSSAPRFFLSTPDFTMWYDFPALVSNTSVASLELTVVPSSNATTLFCSSITIAFAPFSSAQGFTIFTCVPFSLLISMYCTVLSFISEDTRKAPLFRISENSAFWPFQVGNTFMIPLSLKVIMLFSASTTPAFSQPWLLSLT